MYATKLIQNESKLRDFCELILPELTNNECFFVMLSARNKYLTEDQKKTINLRKGSDMLARVLCNSNDYNEVRRSILKMTPVEGLYTDAAGNDIPDNLYTVYITPNPRSVTKATPEIISNLVNSLVNQGNPTNINNAVYSEIHKSCSRKIYYDLDIDLKEGEELQKILEDIKEFIPIPALNVVRTRGGAHVLVNLKNLASPYDKTWYNNILQLKDKYKSDIEMKAETMVPVIGAVQGGFVPYLMFNF
jgi:hypothetical protein